MLSSNTRTAPEQKAQPVRASYYTHCKTLPPPCAAPCLTTITLSNLLFEYKGCSRFVSYQFFRNCQCWMRCTSANDLCRKISTSVRLGRSCSRQSNPSSGRSCSSGFTVSDSLQGPGSHVLVISLLVADTYSHTSGCGCETSHQDNRAAQSRGGDGHHRFVGKRWGSNECNT